jgi:hypothetical protein
VTSCTNNDQQHIDSNVFFALWEGYRLYNATNGYAEGMTIVLHQDPKGTGAIGGTGSSLGVYGGIRNALVIELDTG